MRKVSISDRPVLPALLSLGGAILPSLLLAFFLESAFSPIPDQVGGARSPLTYIFVFVFIGVFSLIVVWYSLITGLAVVSALWPFQFGLTYSPLAVVLVLTPLLGVDGGVLGIIWNPAGKEKKTDNRTWTVTQS